MHKTPLQKWFSQIVTLEEVLQAERQPHPTPDAPPIEKPPIIETPLIPRHLYRQYALAGLAFLVVLTTVWVLSALFLSTIQLGSKKLAATTSDQALAAEIESQAGHYRLNLERPDKSRHGYSLADMGLSVDKSASIQAIRREQHKLGHWLAWWRPIKPSLAIKQDKPALEAFIGREVSVTIQPSQDALLSIENGEIKVKDAVAGKQYGLTNPSADLTTAAASLRGRPLKLRTLTVVPPLTAQALVPYKTKLEKTINQPVSFQLGGRTVTATSADIAAWLEITPDDKNKTVDIAVNSGKVLEYINRLAASEIHPAKAQIEIRQSDGPNRVLVPGVSGVDVTNKQTSATAVAAQLLEASGVSQTLNLSYQAFKTITTDSYPKWIEVDLTNKRMYAYERDNLVRTQLVSAGAPATPTVTGQFAIYAKYTQQDMRGQNVDGSNYFQPHVRWINYFYQDYAIHGNYWRPTSYFGNINSSHGCVGVVDSDAEWMYAWAPIGTPVIVHT